MVLTEPVWSSRKDLVDPLQKGVLLVGDPGHHRDVEHRDPGPGFHKQFLDLFLGTRQKRGGEPDPLPYQLANRIQSLVTLLRLKTVDRENQTGDRLIMSFELLRI